MQKVHIAVFAPFANLVASMPWVPYNHTQIVTSLVLGGSCDAASRQLSGEDVAYVLPIIIWQFSANFRTG